MTSNANQPSRHEAYMHDYGGALTEQVIAGRSAGVHGAFFLPHLCSGMNLLDCGCGPGSITVGLAKAVAPGHVTGIDLEHSQLEQGRETTARLGLTNVTFERGDAYKLGYRDATFDAVFSHAMLEHMRDPLSVLREMRRVLKPGGLVGIRCIDLGGTLIAPTDPTLTQAHDIWTKYREHCGGDPFLGRRLRALLREAGFAKTIASASSEAWATTERAQAFMPVLKDEFTGRKIAETANEKGWADPAQMDKARRALTDWGNHPDAFLSIVWGEAVAWKGKS